MSREKTRLLAISGHDLRQPIQAIALLTRRLHTSLPQAPQQDMLEQIEQANQSLFNLLAPLLDIAKLDSGAMRNNPQVLYLDDVFYRIERQYSALAKQNGMQLRCVSTAQQMMIDPNHLERMVSNLVMNAIQHAGRTGKILLGARQQQQGVRIEVWDNSVGIPEAEQARLFQAFYHSDVSPSHKGVGLGLSIVRQLAELQGCEVGFHSTVGKGCCFYIAFPESLKRA
jgi:histidine kinase